MNTSPLKVGIVGCGNIAKQYFVGLSKFPIVEVVGAADLVPARAQEKATEYGVRPYTVEDLIAEPGVDIIVNLTIPKAHAPINLAVLEAGKHPYSEKPFAVHLPEGKNVLEVAKARGLRVGCAPDTFLGGGIQTARKLLDEGAIGEPIGAIANMAHHGPDQWHHDPEFFFQAGGGPMLDMGPYYVTALVNLLGPIKRVTGSTRASFHERLIGSGPKQGSKIKVEIPTHYAAVFDFASGPVASLNMSFDVWSHTMPIMEIFGSEGTLRVPDPNRFGGVVEVRRSGEKEWRQVPLTHSDQVGRGVGTADMAAAIRHSRPHRVSGELAYHALEAMLAVQIASERGAHVLLESTVQRPAALPIGLPFGEFDA